MNSKNSSDKQRKDRSSPSVLEWVSGSVGAILALGIMGFIAVEIFDSSASGPPLLEVRPTALVGGDGQYIVEVTVANRSGQTASAVEIEGELIQRGSAVETSNASVSYVPGHSERQAGLIFSNDPRLHQLQVRATGYEEP